MSRFLAVAIAAIAYSGVAGAGELKPMHAESIDLGSMAGVAYYTVEPTGYHVVATLSEPETGSPIRFEMLLVSGQTVTLSSPQTHGLPAMAVEISRVADQIVVERIAAIN
jgi:hypothetical protein